MKVYMFSLYVCSLFVIILGLSLTSKVAWAGPQVFDTKDTCTTINCNAATYTGTYEGTFDGNAQPFILQIFAQRNECVRLAVTQQQNDLEMVLISPNGAVWRNDNSGGTPNPLIKARTGSSPDGWYTLQISQFNGLSSNTGFDFTLKYGRYNADNLNCNSPTPIR
jgi:hypothetical protein